LVYARRTEDLTSDKTDDKDAVLIARLTAQLRCYLPEPVDPVWGRLRHLGARREQLLETHTRCVQQIRDLLECVWPAVLDAAAQPFKSTTWVAALAVVVVRDDGNLVRTHRLGLDRFTRLVRAEVIRRGGTKPCLRIVRKVFAAVTATAGVVEHRQAALERVGLDSDRLGTSRHRPGPCREPNGRRPWPARADRPGLFHRWTVPGGRCRDPGRDR
jgi:hypothetical protein